MNTIQPEKSDETWASRKRITFADLVDPRHRHSDFTSPYSGEIYFGLLRWLVAAAAKSDARAWATARKKNARAWRKDVALDSLAGGSRFPDEYLDGIAVHPHEWLAFFREMFDRLLLGRPHDFVRALGVTLGASCIVPAPHRVYGAGRSKGDPYGTDLRISALADYVGRTTRLSYNGSHPKAREVCEVRILVTPRGYSLYAHIDYHDDGGSSWVIPPNGRRRKHCGVSGPTVPEVEGEAFGAFVERAHAVMERILLPSTEVNWYVFTVCRPDKGNEHRGPRPATHRPEAYVLAPTKESAVDFWRARGRVPKDVPLSVTNTSGRAVAQLPADALKRRAAVRVVGGGAKVLDGFSPKNHDVGAIEKVLLAAARAPYRSQPHRW